MIKLNTDKYSDLMSMMYATKHLLNYIDNDIIKYNDINELDLKYLKSRMARVNELITKHDNDEN